jgi:WD40 repeat protein
MGEVWVAKQTEPVKRKVALKLIKTGMDSKAVLQRFEQERQALALMDHPNIARVLDGGLTPTGQPFFVMELVNGLALTRFCDGTKLTPKDRLELFVPICQAVQHAHQKGIVHRDLKPANILVTLIDGRPVPKVIDFGVAKATAGKLTDASLSTHFGVVVGTLEYMAPEQAGYSGQDIDTRADIYSLGVILYELLTGLRPIDARRLKKAALTEMIRIIQEEEPSKPSTRLSTDESLPSLAALRQTEPKKLMALLRGELDWVVMKCLEKQRDRRYETANGLARDIQRYLADEPVEARPPSVGYRLGKFLHRNKGPVAAALVVAGALLLGSVAATWQAVLATRAEKDASSQRDAADQARTAEAAAHRQTERALIESREKTARMTYDRGQILCEEGKADLGLLWMARALELTPPDAPDLDRAIRQSMNLWAGQMSTVRPYPANPQWEGRRGVGAVDDLAVSPDGVSLVTLDDRATLRLWEIATGKLRLVVAPEEKAGFQPLPQIAFSPDGRLLALAHGDRRARVWHAATGQAVKTPFTHDDPVTGVGFDPSGKVLVTAAGKKVRFWNVERGQQAGAGIDLDRPAFGVEVSSDGKRLLIWNREGRVAVWDYRQRRPLHKLAGIDFRVDWAGCSPDGRFVLANGFVQPRNADRRRLVAQLWEADTGRPVGTRMEWENLVIAQGLTRCCFGPDSGVLVTGGFPLRTWQAPTGQPLGALASLGGAERPVFLPDGRGILAFPRMGPAYILAAAPGLRPAQRLPVQEADLIVFTPGPLEQRGVASQLRQGRQVSQLVDLATGGMVGPPVEMEGLPDEWVSPAFSLDGKTVVTGAGKNACQVRETATGQAVGPRLEMTAPVRALAFAPDGWLLAGGDKNGQIRFWKTMTGEQVGPMLAHRRGIRRLCFSPDGHKLLAAGGQPSGVAGEARVWDVGTRQPLGPALEILGEVHDAAFSPDGKTFATGSFKTTVWDTETARPVWTAPEFAVTFQLAFSPDGGRLLSRSFETKSARLFDARTGEPTGPYLRKQAGVIYATFSPDGRLVLTSSEDGSARLWDAATSLPVGPPWNHLSSNPQGVFAADGRSVWLPEEGSFVRWEIPPPLDGSPERIRTAVESATRYALDRSGAMKPLFATIVPDEKRPGRFSSGADPSEPVRQRLAELGGPTGLLRR